MKAVVFFANCRWLMPGKTVNLIRRVLVALPCCIQHPSLPARSQLAQVKGAVQEISTVANYARRFNHHVAPSLHLYIIKMHCTSFVMMPPRYLQMTSLRNYLVRQNWLVKIRMFQRSEWPQPLHALLLVPSCSIHPCLILFVSVCTIWSCD